MGEKFIKWLFTRFEKAFENLIDLISIIFLTPVLMIAFIFWYFTVYKKEN